MLSEEIDESEPVKVDPVCLARQHSGQQRWNVHVRTSIRPRKLRDHEYCSHSRPDHGDAISTAGGQTRAQMNSESPFNAADLISEVTSSLSHFGPS